MLSYPIRSAVIVAASAGTRMRPLTNYLPKALLPVGDKPILIHHLDRLEKFGVSKIVVVVDTNFGQMVESSVRNGFHSESVIRYVIQPDHRGIGDAVLCASDHMLDESFYLILCDEFNQSEDLYRPETNRGFENLHACLSLRTVVSLKQIRATASVHLDQETARVRRFEEKPKPRKVVGRTVFAGQGAFDGEFVKILRTFRNERACFIRDEFSIGHAIQAYIDQGLRVGFVLETGKHIHLTTIADFWSQPRI